MLWSIPAASKPKVPYVGFGAGAITGAGAGAAATSAGGGTTGMGRVAQPPRIVPAARTANKLRMNFNLPTMINDL
jgi:hypothetical protein